MKPVEIIHPVTGQKCFTKHPEKLLSRCRAAQVEGTLFGRPEQLISGFQIKVVDTWTYPHTEWFHGALVETLPATISEPVQTQSAFERATAQLGY